MKSEIFIPLNRKKMMLRAILYFIGGAVAFASIYYGGAALSFMNPTVTKVLSVLFFGFFAVVGATLLKNAQNKKAGLYINHKGVDDQTTNIGLGIIPWKSISSVTYRKEGSKTKMLIMVNSPEKIIDNAMNKAVKRLLEKNVEDYRTPVVIDLSLLLMGEEEVTEALHNFSNNVEISE